MENILYIGKKRVYKTTNANVVGIPREVLKLLNNGVPKEVKVFYDETKKCMSIFFE